ncbi:MAG: hypothetical protein L3K09_02680 [Thermoplasmata archaeon]|nr:hypothetical protein [Thermoplasmata archaeon]
MPEVAGAPRQDFLFRRLDKPEEFRAAEEVHRAAFGPSEEPPTPGSIQRVVQDNGGLVIGAFADIYLAGFTAGFLGWDGSALYHYSLTTAVRPEYQNHHVGFRLKALEREEVTRQGLSLDRWTFDPLSSRNAYLSLRRLGAVADRYLTHYYGQLGPEGNRGLETDRLRVSWPLSGDRVAQRMAGRSPAASEDARRWGESTAVVETVQGESGIRVPVTVTEPSAGRVHIEIPFDIDLVRQHESNSLRTWRHAVRDAFRSAFDAGYAVDDFALLSPEHERRAFYFLSAPEAAKPPPA